ncbi:hypothetical protein VNI00_006775 [Paramarasmius palmivorus]|uniref:Uncharacterized protein n=1 Tax=Paramarasmius palmivorus TaxID=297713 RepID=A0AAW0D6P6_9AGAR
MRLRDDGMSEATNLQPPKYRHKASQGNPVTKPHPASLSPHIPGPSMPSLQHVERSPAPLVFKFKTTKGGSSTSVSPIPHSSQMDKRVFIHYNH